MVVEELEKLRRDNERMRILLDHIDQAILTFGATLFVEPDYTGMVAEIFEKSSLELKDITISELLFTPSDIPQQRQDALEQALKSLFEPQKPSEFPRQTVKDQAIEEALPLLPTECRVNTGNSWKHLSIRWRWIFQKDGQLDRIMLILEDITESKALQIALSMQQERLVSLGETSANFAHEIASPTQLIGLTNQQLALELKQLRNEVSSLFEESTDEASLGLLQHYQSAFDRSLHMIDEISLAQKRLRELHEAVRNYFRQSIAIEAFCVQDVLRECFVICRTRSQHLYLSFDCPEEIAIHGIRSQWMSVLSNLINNACDAILSMESKPQVSLHVFVKVEEVLGLVQITVEDAGPGIPKELHEKIFETSFTTKQLGEGTGLGLAMVKRIVEAHAGTISVDRSPLLMGARFTITIPH